MMLKTFGNTFLILFLTGTIFPGCTSKVNTTKIHEDTNFIVHLKKDSRKNQAVPAVKFQHPLSLNPSEMARILESIQIHVAQKKLIKLFSAPRPDQETAFSDKEINRLAPHFSQALLQADPNDKIYFQFKHRKGLFRGGMTTGVLFVKEDRLHFILGNYKHIPPVKRTDIYRQVDDRIQDSTIGINNPLNTKDIGVVSIVPGAFQEIRETEKDNLKDRWLMIDYKTLLQAKKSPHGPEMTSPSKTSITLPKPTLEERLKTLKKWKEEGLISEEEYTEKKQDLLKEF